jgi:hypothetical protein
MTENLTQIRLIKHLKAIFRNGGSVSTIGSGHEGDPESPSVGTGSSLLDSISMEIAIPIGMDSPPPLDDTLANRKDEQRYRMLLQHEFHPSCTFCLLDPDMTPTP